MSYGILLYTYDIVYAYTVHLLHTLLRIQLCICVCIYTGGVEGDSVLAFGYLPEPSPKLMKELGGLRAPTMVTYTVYIYYMCTIIYIYTMYAL